MSNHYRQQQFDFEGMDRKAEETERTQSPHVQPGKHEWHKHRTMTPIDPALARLNRLRRRFNYDNVAVQAEFERLQDERPLP